MFNCYLYQIAEPVGRLRRPEKLLYLTWLKQDFPQTSLRTVEGMELSILSAGKRNLLEGPDFLEAEIMLGQEILRGAIEIHWKSSDWYSHHHEQDSLYDEVILHVVAQHDLKSPIRNRKGQLIPTFILGQLGEYQEPSWPCRLWPEVNAQQFVKVMHQFFERRWQRKCQNWQNAIAATGAEQAFYLGWLDVLGYSQNRAPLHRLGQLIPIEKIYYILERAGQAPIPVLEALLLGTAGFLDYQIPPGIKDDSVYFQKLKSDWHHLQNEYHLRVGQNLTWHFARVRPPNYPHRRLAAFAQSIVKIFPQYPGQLFLKKLRATNFEQFYRWSEEILQQPEGLWKNHPLLSNSPGKVLMGSERMRDWLTNLVMPYSRAVGIIEKDSLLVDKATLFMEQIPAGELPHVVKQLLQRLHLAPKVMKANWMIQGALEYIQHYCDINLCNLCQLEGHASGS